MYRYNILILGAGEMQLPVILRSKELNHNTIVADYDSNAVGFNYADEKLLVSTNDIPTLLKVSKEHKIDGVLTTSDFPVNSVAIISKELGLNAMSPEVADICTNKYLQRCIFKENNVRTPFFKQCVRVEDLEDLTSFPYIVKPVDSSASRGVKKVENIRMLHKAYKDALAYSKSRMVIVEEFIHGREFSVETLTQNNKTHIINITEKITKGESFGCFVEDTHIEPADISFKEKKLIIDEVLTSIKAIGLNNSPTHTEVKLNEKGCIIIEMACRLGGDYITSDLVPLSTGIDMLESLINISLGLPINIEQKIERCSAVQFLNMSNYDKCVHFIHSASSYIIRSEIKPYKELSIENSLDRLGFIILQTETRREMDLLLKQIQ